MKTTIERLLDFKNVARSYFQKDRKNEQSKIGYAIKKTEKRIDKAVQPYQDLIDDFNAKIEDNNIDLCEADSKGVPVYDIIKDANGRETRHYRFTKDNMKKKNDKIREIKARFKEEEEKILQQEVDFEPYLSNFVPDDFSDEEKIVFSGIVIPE